MMVLAEEDNLVARTAACGSGGGGGGRTECFEPALLPASPDGGDIWGGPLEPSALGGLPILVLCVLGLVSVAWTAFGAATSSGREPNSNKEARVVPPSRSGERSASAPKPPAPAPAPPPPLPPPSPPSGGLTAVEPPGSAEATPPARGDDNHGIFDEGEHSAKVSSSFGRRLSRPDSTAAGCGDRARMEPGGSAGNGGVGMFFNGSTGREGGARVGVDSLGGRVGAAGRGRRPSVSGILDDDGDGDGDSSTCGENGWDPDGWREGEDSWRTSSFASSSVADASLLEDAAAAADRDGAAAAAARRAEAKATHDGVGLVAAADSKLEQRHATGTTEPRSPAGAEVAAAGKKNEGKPGGGAESLAAEREEKEKEEEERRFLATVRGLLVELEEDLDAARVLLPECNRFRKVVRCVAESVGPGMDARPRQAMGLIEALREATEFSRTLSSPEAFLVIMAELLMDGFEDPPAMLGYCTRRLCCVVSALPEPSSSSASRAVAARSQLCSLAKGGPAASGVGGGGSSSGSTRSSLASSTTLAAAAAAAATVAAAAAAAAAVLTPEPPPTAASPTSTATVGVTPVSVSATWAPQDRPSLLVRATAVGAGESGESDGREEGGWRAGETDGGATAAAAAATPARGVAATAEQPAAVDGGDEDGPGGRAGTSGDCAKGDLDSNPGLRSSRMGPALTSEAAGLSELIRRRGGLSALSDGRAVAAVLRAAAPRRQNAFHLQQQPQQQQQRQARSFFDVEAEDGGEAGEASPASLLTPPPRRGPAGGAEASLSRAGGGEEGGAEVAGADGGNSTYVSTSCGGFFGTTKSLAVDSTSGQAAALPWPSPQDANGVYQKLAKRVEARIEAMVPFASPNPTPASERRRVRSAKTFLFSITAGRNGTYTTFVAGNGGGGGGGGGGSGGVSGASRRPAAAPAVAPRRGVSNRCRSSSSAEEDCARYRYHPTSLEEQLYAGLGALLEAAKRLVPGAREGGAAVNAVGETAVLTLKGGCALNRAASVGDTSLSTIPRRASMCQHAVCAPRLGRKSLDAGVRYEDGVLLVPDCRKLRQEIVRSTCMDPAGSVRPDYVAYVGAPIYVDGAPLGTFCVFSRRTLKDLGWTAHHTVVLRGLADAAATEMVRLCRMAELEDRQEQQRHRRRRESPAPGFRSHTSAPAARTMTSRQANGGDAVSPSRGGGSSRLSSRSAPPPDAAAELRRGGEESSLTEGSNPPAAAAAAGSSERETVTGGELSGSGDGSTSTGGGRYVPSRAPLDHRHGVLLLDGLVRAASSSPPRGGGARRSMSEEVVVGGGSSGTFRPPPVLARRHSGDSGAAGGQEAAVAAAAAMALAAAAAESPRGGGAKKRWSRALRKLRLRPRRKSSGGGGSDEGDNGSSSSLDVSRRRTAGGSTDPNQIFRERSRAW